jgi:DNA-directed RNA polymerase I, II, and III subunit RPABC1
MEIDIVIDNLKEMLKNRGDNIDMFEENESVINRDEFYNDKNPIEFQTSSTTIIFALTKKLRKNIIDEIKLYEDNFSNFIQKYNNKKNIIIIFNNDTISVPVLSQINKYDKIIQKLGGMLQYFQLKQLMFNPTKHELVPKHTKLNTAEVAEIMNKYMIKSKLTMPIILHNDPIAKWLGLKQGDIVLIDRYNENSGISYYYRCCI